MTLTEYLFCYSVAPHPPHPNHLSIVSGHALWVLKIDPSVLRWLVASLFCLSFSLNVNGGDLFSWLGPGSSIPSILHCTVMLWKMTQPSPAANDGCGKKLSTLLCNLLCPTCHKYSNGGSAGIPCAGLLVLLWLSGAERLPCSHGGHLTLETTRAQAYYILKTALVLHDMGPNVRVQGAESRPVDGQNWLWKAF